MSKTCCEQNLLMNYQCYWSCRYGHFLLYTGMWICQNKFTLSDHCNSIPSSRSVIHSEPMLLNIHGCYGDLYAFIRHSYQLQFLVSTFLSKMFDVGDLPVLTLGNCVLKIEWLSGLWNYTYLINPVKCPSVRTYVRPYVHNQTQCSHKPNSGRPIC